jgi:SAM-dependent methyltransferase
MIEPLARGDVERGAHEPREVRNSVIGLAPTVRHRNGNHRAEPAVRAAESKVEEGTLEANPRRPLRSDVAAAYDCGVDGYITGWSEVILPPAQAVVAALDIAAGATVLDVGAGGGALIPAIRDSAPDGTAVALDASFEMLRAARERTGACVAQADAHALPVPTASVDAVVLAFVLFHLSDPRNAMTEAARVLRDDGLVGTVTWAKEASLPAYTVWDETLTAAGARALAPRRVDTGLDSPDAMRDLLVAGGFRPTRLWTQSLDHQWTPETYWRLATGSGLNRLRLAALDEQTRADTLRSARRRLAELPPADFAWSGEVVCAVGRRD